MNIKIKRILAFFVDYMFIVLFISMVGQLKFLNPYFDEYYETYEEYIEITDNLTPNDVLDVVLSNNFEELNYKLDKYGLAVSVISLACYLAYFVGFQRWNKNQTLGKKIFNIKVASTNGEEISWKKYFLRTLVLYNMLFDIFIMICMFIFSAHSYMIAKLIISFIGNIVLYLNMGLILFRKDNRGLHDILSGTKIVGV